MKPPQKKTKQNKRNNIKSSKDGQSCDTVHVQGKTKQIVWKMLSNKQCDSYILGNKYGNN